LEYKTAEITVGETTIALHGIPNRYFSAPVSLDEMFEIDDSVYNILLAHEARLRAYSALGVDLSLCGHTHGGIFRLPFVGAVRYRDTLLSDTTTWFPEFRGNEHLKGLIERDGSKLYVSGGLGAYPAPVRFFNRPEIVFVTLLPA
jgi:hypothetical protein